MIRPIFEAALDRGQRVGSRPYYTPMETAAITETSIVRASVDEATKTEAAAVLAGMGLSLSDAVRLLLRRVAADKALPFEPLVPSAETVEATRAARRGEMTRVGHTASLLASLNADGL